mmetsp:Transcript_5999/g.16867  ORF Transcript_5999/g.16867 Transcript_5999/m.16867 type:complete len:113 (-) Transcript_5999:964-1302(-)
MMNDATWNKKVQEELKHSLMEWGVSSDTKQHVQFRTSVMSESRRMLTSQGTRIPYNKLKSQRFPTDQAKAVEMVFRSDIEEEYKRPRYISSNALDMRDRPPFSRQGKAKRGE